jgi:hypothetical protein
MDTDRLVDVEQLVLALLQKQGKDYLTVKQVVAGLPSAPRQRLGLRASQPVAALLRQLTPHLGQRLHVYKGSRSSYIGRNLSPEELIVGRIRQRPGISSKQLGTQLPLMKKPYLTALNALLKTGAVVCTLRDNHTPCLMLVGAQVPLPETTSVESVESGDDRLAFKAVYDEVGQGSDFVRIHRLREALEWTRERFERVLMDLMGDYTVELHGGDPSLLTAADLHNSYTDEHGTLFMTLSWRGRVS